MREGWWRRMILWGPLWSFVLLNASGFKWGCQLLQINYCPWIYTHSFTLHQQTLTCLQNNNTHTQYSSGMTNISRPQQIGTLTTCHFTSLCSDDWDANKISLQSVQMERQTGPLTWVEMMFLINQSWFEWCWCCDTAHLLYPEILVMMSKPEAHGPPKPVDAWRLVLINGPLFSGDPASQRQLYHLSGLKLLSKHPPCWQAEVKWVSPLKGGQSWITTS